MSLLPEPERQRSLAPLDADVEVFPEDAPVSLGHLVQRLQTAVEATIMRTVEVPVTASVTVIGKGKGNGNGESIGKGNGSGNGNVDGNGNGKCNGNGTQV